KIVDWYMDGKIQIDPMITHTLKLEEINKGFDLMHEGKSIRSVVFYCRNFKRKEDRPMNVHIHPSIDNGVKKGSGSFAGGVLVCKCKDKPVKGGVKGDVAHNHACGCTQCWKPEGAVFSVVAVVPRQNVTVLENGDKLHIVDASKTIQRHACKVWG